jgi:hypothetical protein
MADDLARHLVRRTLEAVAGRAGLQFGQRAWLIPGKDAVTPHAISPVNGTITRYPGSYQEHLSRAPWPRPRDPGPFSPGLALFWSPAIRQG